MPILSSELRLAVSNAETITATAKSGASAARIAANTLSVAGKRVGKGVAAIAAVLSADQREDKPALVTALRQASAYINGLASSAAAYGRGITKLNKALSAENFTGLAQLKAAIDVTVAVLDPPPPPPPVDEDGNPITEPV